MSEGIKDGGNDNMASSIHPHGPADPRWITEDGRCLLCADSYHKRLIEKYEAAFKDVVTVRDVFAAKAMQAQISIEGMEGCDKQHISAMSYELADAMLTERTNPK